MTITIDVMTNGYRMPKGQQRTDALCSVEAWLKDLDHPFTPQDILVNYYAIEKKGNRFYGCQRVFRTQVEAMMEDAL